MIIRYRFKSSIKSKKKMEPSRKTAATFTHLSALTQYFPFGYIFPILIWTAKTNQNLWDHNGKQVLNSIELTFILVNASCRGYSILSLAFFKNIPFNA
jgi:uncharacterized Tic20 family protein